VLTPMGPIPESCYHEVPPGTHIVDMGEGAYYEHPVTHTIHSLPRCSARPLVQKAPQEYDGWLAYTTFSYPRGISSFLGRFSVPNNPQNTPEVLYLFTGLQNVDWIPIVDPEPSIFDIIQPVLQYPADSGFGWSVKSWYVTLDSGYIASSEISTKAGDVIFGNMTKTGSMKWFIGGTSIASGQITSISVSRNRLLRQPWAYNTLECYGCSGGCSYYPTVPIKFTDLALFDESRAKVTPTWVAHKSPQDVCRETATIISPSAVTISFQ